ncbi:MAG TPA: arginine deiminase-related protein [Candidatus Dormibacteraeota bacterium]|jgi:N-dimethylarginine dimethylaminohydrolase|nr:arginine deiminase-related protein [Candidatus Dormibacteraeota bacterium]
MSILMCRPDFFGIEYEINPWMKVRNPVDREQASKQWQDLYLSYRRLDQTIDLVEPRPGQPDMVFTANAALVHDRKAVLSHFAYPERQGEEPFWWAALYDRGFEMKLLPGGVAFEGAGDALFVGDRLFAGYGFRTDIEAHRLIGEALDVEVVSLELVDPRFYHLDTCFCPLTRDVVMYAPDAFAPASARTIRQRVAHVIEVPIDVAVAFACNAINVGGRVLSSQGVESLKHDLKHAGFSVLPLPMTEFIKAGGGVRCLSLPLD